MHPGAEHIKQTDSSLQQQQQQQKPQTQQQLRVQQPLLQQPLLQQQQQQQQLQPKQQSSANSASVLQTKSETTKSETSDSQLQAVVQYPCLVKIPLYLFTKKRDRIFICTLESITGPLSQVYSFQGVEYSSPSAVAVAIRRRVIENLPNELVEEPSKTNNVSRIAANGWK